jgi:hypothetical protein
LDKSNINLIFKKQDIKDLREIFQTKEEIFCRKKKVMADLVVKQVERYKKGEEYFGSIS